MKDFSKQTLLANRILIAEPITVMASASDLYYLANEKWPFEIQHIFTHQAGAYNTCNLNVNQTQREWVFLADDDNRCETNLLLAIFSEIKQYGNPMVTKAYHQKSEVKSHKKVLQSSTFGAGNSFVRRELLDQIRFNMAIEFGYREEVDLGMQLRNRGHDVLYLSEPEILYLKASIDSFGTKPVLQWKNDTVQIKPSPTIMQYQILHNAREQTIRI